MPPPITPTPHRFLSSQSQSDRPRLLSALKVESSSSDSQFGQTPRFRIRAPSSTVRRRDAIEDADQDSSPLTASAAARPPRLKTRYEGIDDEPEDEGQLLRGIGSASRHQRSDHLHDAIESIEMDVDDDADTQHVQVPAEEDLMLPPPKRRRMTPPQTSYARRHSSVSISTSESPRRAPGAGTISPGNITREIPIHIPSSPPLRSSSAELSPPPLSPSLNKRGAAPRFRFGKALSDHDGEQEQSISTEALNQPQIRGHGHFILPDVDPAAQHTSLHLANTNLALLFSPQKQKRYSYAPRSMAAIVRDWVLGAATRNSQALRLHVEEVRSERFRDAQLVSGQDGKGHNDAWALVGKPQNDISTIRLGDVLSMMEPSWEVEIEGVYWRVGVRWNVEKKGPP